MSKPAPDIFLKAAELLQIEPENCVVVEDAINGIQAAQSAGMKVIVKVKPSRSKEGFDKADRMFQEFDEISLLDLQHLFNK
jgi:beta-phosphoglucomutase-like phosphatase (HAD superfamily)